jgi:hypothetical protein
MNIVRSNFKCSGDWCSQVNWRPLIVWGQGSVVYDTPETVPFFGGAGMQQPSEGGNSQRRRRCQETRSKSAKFSKKSTKTFKSQEHERHAGGQHSAYPTRAEIRRGGAAEGDYCHVRRAIGEAKRREIEAYMPQSGYWPVAGGMTLALQFFRPFVHALAGPP